MQKIIKTEIMEAFIKEKGYSKREFCKRCKISYSTLQKMMVQDCSFHIRALFKIAREMGIRVCDLFLQ